MTQASSIEWTDKTWNPVRGCTKISPGCKHCYAETFAERFRGVAGHPYEHGFDLGLIPSKLDEPLRLTKPSRIFVNSMSDLFQVGVPDDYIEAVAEVMRAATWHQFQVLTKRADRMRELAERGIFDADNIALGVSVEDRRHGLPRIEHLRRTRARHRFLSCEPLLEYLGPIRSLEGIELVIVGGESGPRLTIRPMHPAWARSLRDQCLAAGVLFHFKQWGVWEPCEPALARFWLSCGGQRLLGPELACAVPMRRIGKNEGSGLLDGVLHDDLPAFEPVVIGEKVRRALVARFETRAKELAVA